MKHIEVKSKDWGILDELSNHPELDHEKLLKEMGTHWSRQPSKNPRIKMLFNMDRDTNGEVSGYEWGYWRD